ncbi:MAG: hypothetical protein RLZZ367_145 [Bacteroidota bacterium]|jgi:hypothetical protein
METLAPGELQFHSQVYCKSVITCANNWGNKL